MNRLKLAIMVKEFLEVEGIPANKRNAQQKKDYREMRAALDRTWQLVFNQVGHVESPRKSAEEEGDATDE